MLVEISNDTSKRYTVPVLRYEISDDDSEDFAMPKIFGMDTIVISFSAEPSFYYSYEDEDGFVEEDAPQTSIYSYDDDVTVTFLGNEISLFGANDLNSTTFIDLGITRDVFEDGTTLDTLWSHVNIENDSLESEYLGSFAWALNADLEITDQTEFEEFLSANPIAETIEIPADVAYGPNKSDWLVSALASSGIEPEEVQIDGANENSTDIETPSFQEFSGDGHSVSYDEAAKLLTITTNSGIESTVALPQRSDVVEYQQQDYHYAYEFSAAISNTAAMVSYSGERAFRGEILGQLYGLDGSRVGSEIVFSSQTDQGHRSSIWAIDGERFLALWQTNNPDWLPPLDDMVGYVVGRVYNFTDNSLADTFVVAGQTNLLETPPTIEISDTGAFNITWREYDLSGDELGPSEMVYGGEINEFISGSSNADYLYGQGGDDEINGLAGDDLLDGGEGNDTLTGGDGDDIILAGEGDDLIIGGDGEGDDKYDGGVGVDTVKYTSATAGITVDLLSGVALSSDTNQDAKIGQDTLKDIENIIAGDFSDYLIGSDDANILQVGKGSDFVEAGSGNDTIILDVNGTYGSNLAALNISSSLQTGTEERISLNGKNRFEDVMDGGAGADTVALTDGSDAFFLHDSFSGFHSSLTLSNDDEGRGHSV